MKILDSYWFTPMGAPVVGVVKCQNEVGEIKYYIGNDYSNNDQEAAEKYISERGAKVPTHIGEAIFS